MSAIVLQSLLYALAQMADYAEVEPDLTGLDAALGRRLTEALRRSYAEHYETPFPWPESIAGESLALTGGRFQRSAIGDGDWWEGWSADPRPKGSTAIPIVTRADADGIWADTSASSVFVLWRRAAPRLQYVPVVAETTYAAGKVVYDNTSGDCYEALVGADGDELVDEEKWRRLTLVGALQECTLIHARGLLLENAGQSATAAEKYFTRARDKRETEFTKAYESGRYGAWWQNRN